MVVAVQTFSAEATDEIRGRPEEPLDGAAREKSSALIRGLGARWSCPTSHLDQLVAGVEAHCVDQTACETLLPGGRR